MRVCAGSASARTKLSNPAGSVTRRKRAWREVTVNVCGMSRGPYTNDPGGCLDHPSADPEGQLTFDDGEPLVLSPVDVQRRPRALRCQVLDDRDAAFGCLARGLDRGQEPRNQSASPSPGCNAIGFTAVLWAVLTFGSFQYFAKHHVSRRVPEDTQ